MDEWAPAAQDAFRELPQLCRGRPFALALAGGAVVGVPRSADDRAADSEEQDHSSPAASPVPVAGPNVPILLSLHRALTTLTISPPTAAAPTARTDDVSPEAAVSTALSPSSSADSLSDVSRPLALPKHVDLAKDTRWLLQVLHLCVECLNVGAPALGSADTEPADDNDSHLDRLLYERLRDFVIFAPHVFVPRETFTAMWGIANTAAARTQDILERALRRGFFLRTEGQPELFIHSALFMYLSLTANRHARSTTQRHAQLVGGYVAIAGRSWPVVADDGYLYRYIAEHLTHGRLRAVLVEQLLMRLEWLDAKIRVVGVDELLRDFALVANHRTCGSLSAAIRAGAAAIHDSPLALRSQLLGRLGTRVPPDAKELMAAVSRATVYSWLCPVTTPLLALPLPKATSYGSGLSGAAAAMAQAAQDEEDVDMMMWGDQRPPATLKVLQTIRSNETSVLAVALSSDATRALSGAQDGTLRLLDVRKGAQQLLLSGHEGCIRAVAMTGDAAFAATVSHDGSLKYWTLQKLTTPQVLCVVPGSRAVAISRDGRRVCSGGDDGAVIVVDMCDRAPPVVRSFPCHEGPITSVAVTANGRRALSAGYDGTLRLLDIPQGGVLHTLRGHTGAVTCCALSDDCRVIVSGGQDGTVRVWDGVRGAELHVLGHHMGTVTSCVLSSAGTRAVSCCLDGTVVVWDLLSSTAACTVQEKEGVSALALNGDARTLVTASTDHLVRSYLLPLDPEAAHLSMHHAPVTTLARNTQGKLAVSASVDGNLKIWDLERARIMHSIAAHQAPITRCAMTDNIVASASQDGLLRVWEASRGSLLHNIVAHSETITALCYTGRRILTGAQDGSSKLWDVGRGNLVAALSHHPSAITAVALSGDGRRAVTASEDGSVNLWNVSLATPSSSALPGEIAEPVNALFFSINSQQLLAATASGTVMVWNVDPCELVCVTRTPVYHGVVTRPLGVSKQFMLFAAGSSVYLHSLSSGELVSSFRCDAEVSCGTVSDLVPDSLATAGAELPLVMVGDISGSVHTLRLMKGRKLARKIIPVCL